MSAKTDKANGRTKQVVGLITGDDKMKKEGQRQEDTGKLKSGVDSIASKARGALDHLK
jgi:uncharacterized protein YjbJ (UPF0337 family)